MNTCSSDRSWNDPPVVKFESTGTNKKSHLLKKKVLNDSSSLQSSLGDVCNDQIKCTSLETSQEIPKSNDDVLVASVDENEFSSQTSDEEMLLYIMNILLSILHESPDQKNKTEIEKRLKIMEESWKSKLSKEVKGKMYILVKALDKGQIDAATDCHYTLMIHYVREVKSWMVGVKHIIEMKRKASDSSTSPLNDDID